MKENYKVEKRHYKLDEIEKLLGDDLFRDFNKWFRGQTGLLKDGKMYVYWWDLDRFLKGLSPFW